VVQEEQVADVAPAPAFGTFADGTYFLTAVTIYTGDGGASGPSGHTHQQTSVASGGAAQSVSSDDNGCASHSNSQIAFSDAGLTITGTCPACMPSPCGTVTLGYTAGPSGFMLFLPSGTNIVVETYTHQ
jgi:hypothetical protein